MNSLPLYDASLLEVLDRLKADYGDLQIKESMPLIDYENYGFMAHTFRVNNPKGGYSVEIVIGPTLEEKDF